MENFMIIQNETLYHITCNSELKTGDIIISGNQENPFWLSCKNYSPQILVDKQSMSVFKMFDCTPPFDVTQDTIDFLYQQLKNISTEFAFYVREQTFEDVRKKLYPQLPSRQKCLWLSDENNLSYWKTLHTDESQYLLALNLHGNVFRADAHWLKANTFSSIEYAERANQYWSGKLSNTPKTEYLFYGRAVIEKIVPLHSL